MAKICYVPKNFSPERLDRLAKAQKVVTQFKALGFVLTLRQCFYQFVKNNWIENNERSYENLGTLISDARIAGHLDWDMFEDRTRNIKGLSHWDSPRELLEAAAAQFRLDWWDGQPVKPEIWVEKEALSNIVERVARRNDVNYLCCRGYMSQSEMHTAAQRFTDKAKYWDQQSVIIYIGDHDPSGMDMSEDIKRRLQMFQADVPVLRVALNMDQIRAYDMPPNPAKLSDGRAAKYIEQYGPESWELDAFDPVALDNLLDSAVKDQIGKPERYELQQRRQDDYRSELAAFAAKYDSDEGYGDDRDAV